MPGRRPALSKQAAQFRHAVKRARERYGLELDRDQYMVLCQQIQDGVGEYLGRQSNRLTVWRIGYGGCSYNVVYDKQRHRIVTFLPPGIIDAKGVSLLAQEEVVHEE